MSYTHPVPPRALAISAGALAVSLIGALVFPQSIVDYGFLVWLLPMIPAFLLCYYRRWTRLMFMLAATMAMTSLGYVVALRFATSVPEWPLLGFVIAVYICIALGAGWFPEVREAVLERVAAERELRQSNLNLRKSHTDLQLANWKLIEAEKLEAVGQLAAGVAHEVKNPLMTLVTGVRYLQNRFPTEDADLKTLLVDMLDAAKRANTVITGLLDFSAPRELVLALEDLNAVIRRSAALVKHELTKARVTLELELGADLPRVALDVFKIEQVLVNVLTNAAHATPPGGRITVRTYRRANRGSDLSQRTQVDGFDMTDKVTVLEVDDTGSGIAPEALGKLFNPFFTTKPPGKGTGLGLAVSRQIVDMHGASIRIENRPEGGARVTMAFGVPKEKA